jgi:AcrR family transcriptional regulator
VIAETRTGRAGVTGARSRVLDAAFHLARRDGVAAMTLEAVASRARVSKGGLLYHFPSKDALVRGMVEDLQRIFEGSLGGAAAADPRPRGRSARAYLDACVGADRRHSIRWLALIGALVQDPSLLEPWRAMVAGLPDADRAEGTDPVVAAIVRLAADGLWLADVLGTQPLTPAIRRRAIRRLRKLSMEGAA